MTFRTVRFTLFLLVLVCFVVFPVVHSQGPRDVESRVNALLAQMTLEEKLGQLQQLDGEGNGNFRPEHLELVRKGLLGSTLNVRGAQRTNQVQRVAMNESRLKIPVLFGFDVIHGYRTIFPIPLAEASSWDPALAERSAAVAAQEDGAATVPGREHEVRRRVEVAVDREVVGEAVGAGPGPDPACAAEPHGRLRQGSGCAYNRAMSSDLAQRA